MKAIVIYKSRYGSTEQYAQWIAASLHCPLLEERAVRKDQLEQYDVIIFGGGLYAGSINGIRTLTRNYHDLHVKGKTWILFTVGLADPHDTAAFSPTLEKVLTPEIREDIHIFHFRGGMDYARLSLPHRAMMKMMIKFLCQKPVSERNDQENDLINSYGGSVDFVSKDSIEPLISFVASLEGA